jgi:hypothetical protein
VTAGQVPTQTRGHLRRQVLLVAVAGAVAWIGSGFQSHSTSATVAVALTAVAVLVLAVRRPAGTAVHTPRLRRALVWWSALLVAALLWEAYAFVQQPDWTAASYAHPTLSTLLDPILEQRPFRLVGWLIWLRAGWVLVPR